MLPTFDHVPFTTRPWHVDNGLVWLGLDLVGVVRLDLSMEQVKEKVVNFSRLLGVCPYCDTLIIFTISTHYSWSKGEFGRHFTWPQSLDSFRRTRNTRCRIKKTCIARPLRRATENDDICLLLLVYIYSIVPRHRTGDLKSVEFTKWQPFIKRLLFNVQKGTYLY